MCAGLERQLAARWSGLKRGSTQVAGRGQVLGFIGPQPVWRVSTDRSNRDPLSARDCANGRARHHFRTVVTLDHQMMSWTESPASTTKGMGMPRTGGLILEPRQTCNSECPSAKDRPEPPAWKLAG